MGRHRSSIGFKIKSYDAIPVNLLLWGSKNWIINKNYIGMIEPFYHKDVYIILKFSMSRVKEDMIKKTQPSDNGFDA